MTAHASRPGPENERPHECVVVERGVPELGSQLIQRKIDLQRCTIALERHRETGCQHTLRPVHPVAKRTELRATSKAGDTSIETGTLSVFTFIDTVGIGVSTIICEVAIRISRSHRAHGRG